MLVVNSSSPAQNIGEFMKGARASSKNTMGYGIATG